MILVLTDGTEVDAGLVKEETIEKNYTELAYQETRLESGEKAFLVCGFATIKYIDVIIPSTYQGCPVVGIADFAFQGEKIESIVIPDSVTSIGDYAFEYCGSLTSIVIPDSVSELGSGAFIKCFSLKSIVIPNGVLEIKSGTFSGCNSLTSVVIGNGVASIRHYAFASCTSLTSIEIPDNVTRIEANAFQGCSSLTSVTIGSGMTFIGFETFVECTKLTKITFNGTTERWKEILLYQGWDRGTGDYTVYCTDGTLKKGEF